MGYGAKPHENQITASPKGCRGEKINRASPWTHRILRSYILHWYNNSSFYLLLCMYRTSRRSIITQNIVRDDVRRMWSYLWKASVVFLFIIWSLLFFLNLLWWVSVQANKVGETLSDKLSMYFHIVEDESDREAIENRVRELETVLTDNAIQTRYITKEQARSYFSQRMPDIAGKFEQYGIDNPLQASLYVIVDDQEDYDALVSILPQYIDIITNISDIQETLSLEQQESLVIKTLRATEFLRVWSYVLMLIFALIMWVVLWQMTRQLMYHYRDKIQTKSLLWAEISVITQPFVLFNVSLFVLGYGVMLVLFLIAYSVLLQYDMELVLFEDRSDIDLWLTNIFGILANAWYVLLAEFIVLGGLMAIVTHFSVFHEIKRKHW